MGYTIVSGYTPSPVALHENHANIFLHKCFKTFSYKYVNPRKWIDCTSSTGSKNPGKKFLDFYSLWPHGLMGCQSVVLIWFSVVIKFV